MKDKTRDQNTTQLSKDQINRLWEWKLHEDYLFSNRINFFMVAESIFFAAFAALLVVRQNNSNLITILGIAGILFSLVWFYVLTVQIYFTIKPIKQILLEKLPEYQYIDHGRKRVERSNSLLGCILPLVFLFIWIVLIATY